MEKAENPVSEMDLEILEWLKPVQDPELHMSLVDLGLIYEIERSALNSVRVEMTLTSPNCPAADYLVDQVRQRLLEHAQIEEAEVKLVFEPAWNPKERASDEAKEVLGIW